MLQPLSFAFTDPGTQTVTPSPVTCVRFDNEEELVWAGNAGGHLTSLCNTTAGELQKYTSVQIQRNRDLRTLLTGEFGVLSLSQDKLSLHHRRGARIFNYQSQILRDMQCMEILPSGLVLLGGHHKDLMEFDLDRRRVIRTTELEEGCVIIRNHQQFVCTGDLGGRISIRDPHTLKVQHRFSTHTVTLSDFDVHCNYLITCGFSNRHSCAPDRFLMVYDLRMMQAVAPIPMAFAPYLLKFVPAFSSRFCVISQTGKLQFFDVSSKLDTPLVDNLQLQPGNFVNSFDISSTCQAFAFGDSTGGVHLHGTNEEVLFNTYSRETELVDAPLTPPPSIAFDDLLTPFTSIPLPDTPDISPLSSGDKLLSDWPEKLSTIQYRYVK